MIVKICRRHWQFIDKTEGSENTQGRLHHQRPRRWMQVGAINDRIDGRTEGGKGKETKDGKEASFADLKRRKWQTAVKEKYLLGMDAVRFLQGRQGHFSDFFVRFASAPVSKFVD
jgi:hypothetical protein